MTSPMQNYPTISPVEQLVASEALSTAPTTSTLEKKGSVEGGQSGSRTAVLAALRNPQSQLHVQHFISEPLYDIFLSELVQAVIRSTRSRLHRERADMNGLVRGLSLSDMQLLMAQTIGTHNKSEDQPFSDGSDETRPNESNSDDHDELILQQIEAIGYRVGYSLAEKVCRDKPRFSDNLEIIKFICKDFWIFLFKKPIDNLKTNHRGTFVLHDNQFPWLLKNVTLGTLPHDMQLSIRPYLTFPCGILRGALANLELQCIVVAEVQSSPQCIFKLETIHPAHLTQPSIGK